MPPGDGEPGAGRGKTIPAMDPYKGFGKGAGEREGAQPASHEIQPPPKPKAQGAQSADLPAGRREW